MSSARMSMGGSVVAQSLHQVGYVGRAGVALVETAKPRPGGHDVLLAQNAWNFIPSEFFMTELCRYPLSMRTRIVARRLVSRLNVRAARRVVCMTTAMADLVFRATDRRPEVLPTTLPLDVYGSEQFVPELRGRKFSMIPGTVTWYKRTAIGVDYLAANDTEAELILLAGIDDGSSHSGLVREHARRAGIDVEIRPLARPEMIWALKNAQSIVLPSSIESLGFSLSESLVLSGRVVASEIPAHREISDRLGIYPRWLPGAKGPHGLEQPSCSQGGSSKVPHQSEIREEWSRLAQALQGS